MKARPSAVFQLTFFHLKQSVEMPPKKCVLPLVQLSLKTIPGMVRKHATLTADHLVELWWKQKQDSEKKSNFKYQNREKVKFRLKAI